MQAKELYLEQKSFLKGLLRDMNRLEQENNKFYIDYSQTLKAQYVFMLYTALESVVIQSIQDIFDTITLEGRKFYELNDALKRIYFKAKITNKTRHFNEIVSDENFLKIIDTIVHKQTIEITPKEDFKNENPFKASSLDMKNIKENIFKNFNIDESKLTNIVEKWNIKLKMSISELLREIKKARNQLAHGEMSFQDFGKNKTIQDLKKYYTAISVFLFYYLQSIEQYIAKQSYLEH